LALVGGSLEETEGLKRTSPQLLEPQDPGIFRSINGNLILRLQWISDIEGLRKSKSSIPLMKISTAVLSNRALEQHHILPDLLILSGSKASRIGNLQL
jgi:hypothetical protein